jgi:RIO kinase 1
VSKVYRRRRWNDDDPRFVLPSPRGDEPAPTPPELDEGLPPGARWANWAEADARGPLPPPAWLVTDGDAVDHDRGIVKTGKEADVHLVERTTPAGRSCLLAVKRYRDRDHRLFHRDAGYLDGRRVRRSRETRAMANRTDIGLEIIAGQWAVAEFRALARLHGAGLPVPYPVQLDGTDLTLEFLGEGDGTAAPRLAQLRPGPAELAALWVDLWASLCGLADAGFAHGDLSAYNLLVHAGRVWLIDLPQVVDVVGNPQGIAFLRRDVANVAAWFAARGLPHDVDALASELADRALGR